MPGMMSWKQLYGGEYLQLFEEGYDVGGDNPKPDVDDLYIAFGDQGEVKGSEMSEAQWEAAYHELWKCREKGLRPDFRFVEPDDWDEIIADSGDVPDLEPLDDKEYADRIKGAWFGRIAGVIQGKPVEMAHKDMIKEYLQKKESWELEDYIPYEPDAARVKHFKTSCRGHITHAVRDDDIDYVIMGLLHYERHGRDFTQEDICMDWINLLPYGVLYSCTKQAYWHITNRTYDRPFEDQIKDFAETYNHMREGINGTIRTDFHGYINPCNPRSAAAHAYREGMINCRKNGIYGMCFIAACISAALSKNPTLETIIEAGMSVVPKKSRLYEAIEWIKELHGEGKGWEYVNDKIYEKWQHINWAGVMINIPICVLALLEGQMDYTRTISVASMAGIDTDCNAATVGSIIGAAKGFDAVPAKFKDPLNDTADATVAGVGKGSITGFVERTVELYHRLEEKD